MGDFLRDLRSELAAEGLDHVGVVSRDRYDAVAPPPVACDALHPQTRSIVVVASGGRLHWDRMMAHIAGDPRERLARTSHPLDDFGKSVFSRLSGLLAGCRVLYPHLGAPVTLHFMKLGELAGLGRESELGLLVSSRYGPWMGFRAAIFTPHELSESAPDRRLCDGCPAPCRSACPGGVVGDWSFPWNRCVSFRRWGGSPCASSCAAREACVVARDHMYSDLQRLYHYDRAAGRRELCRAFGVDDEAGP